jgi:inosose dehydratase
VLDAPEDLAEEKARVGAQLELFRSLGAACLAYGETAGTVQNQQNVPLTMRRRLSEDEIRTYGRCPTRFAENCADAGVPLAFHHHMGTAIETEQDLDLLMKHTGEAVGLLYDTGHMRFAGGDLLRVIDNHAKRIVHVHTKDVRGHVIGGLEAGRHSFLEAVVAGAVTVPGDGAIDLPPSHSGSPL